MSNVLLYYAHPGHIHSKANKALIEAADAVSGITRVDLYADYPRFDINIDREQSRLLEHDIYIFQHPLFWYSVPALIKEWIDLVLEHGFAYGSHGDRLAGKVMMQAITAAGPEGAYTEAGYQHFALRTFLTPMEQTAILCKMHYAPPYVLYSALGAADKGALRPHVEGYVRLLEALRDDTYDFDQAGALATIGPASLPIVERA